ncbi:MAG: class I SAM-dependent methyltransferase, partial [Proteobacteria bacterium]|nr:class I SAM-dependent methyltransferase [Pseudomonadota bacterium]
RGHYAGDGLMDRLVAALVEMGHDPDDPPAEAVSQLDQMHIRGAAATTELHDAMGIGPDDSVLDVGCGIGGPARALATRLGCPVTGLDLTPDFCACARELNYLLGVEDLVEIVEGSALDMPFDDESFDAVVTQHASMNIEDKAALYREIARVLEPGGRFGFYDIMQGPGGDVHYPAPWAVNPEISFLAEPDAVKALIEAAGLRQLKWEDVSEKGLAWMAEQKAAREAKAARGEADGPTGPSVLMRHGAAEKLRNIARNLHEGRIVTILGVFEKP